MGDDWDLHLGVKQIFWGVTEFNHLVDIINQTDLVENIDGEDKLGQPMAHLSLVRDWGILDFHLLTGFRERTFPGRTAVRGSTCPSTRTRPATNRVPADRDRRRDPLVSPHRCRSNSASTTFSGTSRAPLLTAWADHAGEVACCGRTIR